MVSRPRLLALLVVFLAIAAGGPAAAATAEE